MDQKSILERFTDILTEARFLIQNKSVSVYKLQEEKDPNDYGFPWKSKVPESLEIQKKQQKENQRKNKDLVNFSCTFCQGKLSGVRQFLHKGRKPVLVLHYTGATNPKEKPFTKTKPNQIFKDKLTESSWGELVQKVFGFSFEEFFYQEYPACTFSHTDSKETDWTTRVENCKFHVKETVEEYGIKMIVILGSSAKLLFGAEKAKELLGKEIKWDLSGLSIPIVTTRSPEALVFLGEKAKKSDSETNLFQYGKEKQDLEESFISHLSLLKPYL